MTEYTAHVHVDNYDDDFILIHTEMHIPIYEGKDSQACYAATPAEALYNLVSSLLVTDYNMQFHPNNVPERYHHVGAVRDMLKALADKAASGIIDPEDLHWGGNWNITFVVQAATPDQDLVFSLLKCEYDLISEMNCVVTKASQLLHAAANEILRLNAHTGP